MRLLIVSVSVSEKPFAGFRNPIQVHEVRDPLADGGMASFRRVLIFPSTDAHDHAGTDRFSRLFSSLTTLQAD